MNNKIYDAFKTITADDELKSKTKQFLKNKRAKNFNPFYKFAFVFSAIFIIFAVYTGYSLIQTPVSFISIDVNPSIELALNRFDTVISMKAYNDDGEKILSDVDIYGKSYDEAIDIIVKNEDIQGYLYNDSYLTFSIASNDSEKSDYLSQNIINGDSCKKYKGECFNADTKIIEDAHNKGISFGKYSAYLILKKYDSSITVDECKNMTMKEIKSRISNFSNESAQKVNCRRGNGGNNHNNKHFNRQNK